MKLSISDLKNKMPSYLEGLNCEIVSIKLPSNWNTGNNFVTRSIKCNCGEMNLILKSSSEKKIKGFFKKREIVEFLAPIAIKCSSCSFERVIFDPRVNGYNGALGINSSRVGKSEIKPISEETVKVFINYSYQGLENYEDLMEEGIGNLQDYYDTFQVYFQQIGNKKLSQLVTYECA